MRWDIMKQGWRYGARAGCVCAEFFIVCMALYNALFGNLPLAILILFYGQFIGALPAILLGALLSICASVLVSVFPQMLIKVGGVLWGIFYGLAVLIIISGLILWLTNTPFAELTSIQDINSSHKSYPEEFAAFWAVIVLYLCSGAWAGSKLEKLTRLYYQNN